MSRQFTLAVFDCAGDLVGSVEKDINKLSQRWLSVCSDMLSRHGESFRVSFGGPLQHIEVKLTAARGAGLGMIFAHGQLAVSTAYFQGEDAIAEDHIVQMLLESLRGAPNVRLAASTEQPFDGIRNLQHRPLGAVIAWRNPSIKDEDTELIQELSVHFAAAYLCQAKLDFR